MKLFEWGVSGRASRPGTRPVGISGSRQRAQDRMLEALAEVPSGVRACGWVTALALGADRLTYDRLVTLARVSRERDGSLCWVTGGDEPRDAPDGGVADVLRMPEHTAVVDGQLLRRLRMARGLSQERLAWRAGLGLTTVARLERDPLPACRGKTVASLASVLGENPRALVAADDPA